ncbi:MAG: hypothetical protein Q3990_03940 [Desulfovibrionaceae bacterium]|nr:hypothetical protein [Desulfovibrionaceae bacterium]
MKKLNVFYNACGKRSFAGILAEEKGHIFFEYAPEFIDRGHRALPFQAALETWRL